MRFLLSLLLSLALHGLLLLAAKYAFDQHQTPEPSRLEVTLVRPPVEPEPVTEAAPLIESIPTPLPATAPPAPAPTKPAVTTPATPTTPTTPAIPKPMQGRALQRAHGELSQHLLYPPEAVSRGIEGDVTLLLILDASGNIRSVEVARSSGHRILDQAALVAARQLGAMPGNPAQTLLPVSFRLQ